MFLTVSDPSSTALHLLLHANILYTILWFILEIVLFIFKYFHLSYARHAFGLEFSIVFILCCNEFLRQFFGRKGNLMLQTNLLIFFLVYGVFCAIGFVFFLLWQSYIQRVEILLSGISLALILIEVLLSIIVLIRNRRAMPVLTSDEKLRRFNRANKQFITS